MEQMDWSTTDVSSEKEEDIAKHLRSELREYCIRLYKVTLLDGVN
jgi:hypothetical protein